MQTRKSSKRKLFPRFFGFDNSLIVNLSFDPVLLFSFYKVNNNQGLEELKKLVSDVDFGIFNILPYSKRLNNMFIECRGAHGFWGSNTAATHTPAPLGNWLTRLQMSVQTLWHRTGTLCQGGASYQGGDLSPPPTTSTQRRRQHVVPCVEYDKEMVRLLIFFWQS